MKILLRNLLLATVIWSIADLSGKGQAAAPDRPQARLGSTVFKWEDLEVKPLKVGEYRRVFDSPTATLEKLESHITTLNPGSTPHPPHRHPYEEFIIIKEGIVDVILNGQSHRAGPGSFLFYASNDSHTVRNAGDKPATYIVCSLGTAATRTVPTQPAVESAPSGTLRSRVFDWEKLPVTPTKVGARREIANSPTITCTNFRVHVTTLNPGEMPHAAHRHPDEELIVVKEGLLEIAANGVTQQAGPGSIFFAASNEEHGLKNAGVTTATYYVIRIATAATPAPQKN